MYLKATFQGDDSVYIYMYMYFLPTYLPTNQQTHPHTHPHIYMWFSENRKRV